MSDCLRPAPWLVGRPFAHRGLHDKEAGIPENSLAAFRRAVAHGYAIELDVRQLADGSVVVFHDATLARLCGQPVRLATLGGAAVQQYRLLGTAEGIPSLAAALAVVSGQVPLLIELKGWGRPEPLARAVVAALATYAGPVAVQAFNPLVVRWFGRHAPGLLRGQLAGSFRELGWGAGVARWVSRRLLGLGCPDFLACEAATLPSPAVARYRAAGQPVLAWTVRSAAEATQVCPTHCDNLIFEHFQPAVL